MLTQEILVKWWLYSLIVTLPLFFVFLILLKISPKSKVVLRFRTISIFTLILSVVALGCLEAFVVVRAEKSFFLALNAAFCVFALAAVFILLECGTRSRNNPFLFYFSALGMLIIASIALALAF